MPWEFTGYDPRMENRAALREQCLHGFNIMDLTADSDLPPTRGIKELMRRDDQARMNSCSGFGMTNSAEVTFFLQTGKWRQFNPLWSYRRGQEISGIRGDRGATIHGVVTAASKTGLLPEDLDNDGKAEYPYVVDYNFPFPRDCYGYAGKWKIGYKLELRGFDEILRFLQTNQGAVIVGGAWGNWKPNADGIANRFYAGGGGHARAYIDWITIDNKILLVEVNSHYKTYGKNGYAFHTKTFVDGQAKDKWTVTIGVSDLSNPEPRHIDWSRDLTFIPDNPIQPVDNPGSPFPDLGQSEGMLA